MPIHVSIVHVSIVGLVVLAVCLRLVGFLLVVAVLIAVIARIIAMSPVFIMGLFRPSPLRSLVMGVAALATSSPSAL
jgi:hypothetical protein